MKQVLLNKKDKSVVQAQLKLLDVSYIDKIMKLQDDVYARLDNKEFFACSDKKNLKLL
ncbi:hypothetical protein DFH43_004816 [Clostridium beijerinckii]|nr:hypothetical protein [Clostridium beijerinckii]NSA02011.1 hypothetical protein [Clostridium beijerinckii]